MVTTALREKMRAILRARNYSLRTEETYISAVAHFARHFRTSPDRLGAEHVAQYQVWLRDSSQQATRGRSLARRCRASRFVGPGVNLADM